MDIMKDKEMFVSAIGNTIVAFNKATRKEYFDGLKDLKYVNSENGEEYIYAVFGENMQKRVCITADSVEATLTDFAVNIGSAPWIHAGDPRFKNFK